MKMRNDIEVLKTNKETHFVQLRIHADRIVKKICEKYGSKKKFVVQLLVVSDDEDIKCAFDYNRSMDNYSIVRITTDGVIVAPKINVKNNVKNKVQNGLSNKQVDTWGVTDFINYFNEKHFRYYGNKSVEVAETARGILVVKMKKIIDTLKKYGKRNKDVVAYINWAIETNKKVMTIALLTAPTLINEFLSQSNSKIRGGRSARFHR